MTYADYVTLMKTLLVIDSETNPNFLVILPNMIAYAENRIYRDLDLISAMTEATGDCTPGTRAISVPGSIQIVQSAAIITPAATTPALGVRYPLQRVSVEFLNSVWPTQSSTGRPLYYALLTDVSILLAPTPDAAYKLAATGPIRPAPLSVSNTTTWISLNLPELFTAASMVYGTGWQRDFGAQSDDPASAVSWEQQYQTLLQSADVDDARRKAQSASWQPYQPVPGAKESRTNGGQF